MIAICFAVFVRLLCRCVGPVRDECDSQIGWTALFYAALNGRTDCVRLLIDAGADTEAKCNVRVLQLHYTPVLTFTQYSRFQFCLPHCDHHFLAI